MKTKKNKSQTNSKRKTLSIPQITAKKKPAKAVPKQKPLHVLVYEWEERLSKLRFDCGNIVATEFTLSGDENTLGEIQQDLELAVEAMQDLIELFGEDFTVADARAKAAA